MLSGQVILVSGAAGRLGSAIAHEVASQGGKLVLFDINAEALQRLVGLLPVGSSVECVGDASIPVDVDTAINAGVNAFGTVDGAVHGAYPRSPGWGTPFEQLTPEHLFEDLSRQLGGAILFSQRVLLFFKENGHGNLIHLSSIQGIAAPKFEHYEKTEMVSPVEYTAIKHGVIGLTRYMAKYYAGMGIRVNCVSPGGIIDNQPEVFQERYRSSCNAKGLLEASDVAGAVTFLLGPESKLINGQNIIVDDGWSL